MNRMGRQLFVVVVLVGAGAWLALAWLEDSYGEQPYALVEDGLYLGGSVARPPPGTQAVVNLCGRKDPYEVDARLWEPIGEGKKEATLPWLRRVVKFIAGRRRAGQTTYVHCMAGVNRSAFVVTAYLMAEHGWGREEALALVRAKRPQARPNPGLMHLLAEWERELKEEGAVGP